MRILRRTFIALLPLLFPLTGLAQSSQPKETPVRDEIAFIESQVDPLTWEAIQAVRKIGNIGAHMEKDIGVIVEVDPNEADLLIELIETLLREWYVHREERKMRMGHLVAAAAAKK